MHTSWTSITKVALAGLGLIALASRPAEASSISCGFGGDLTSSAGCSRGVTDAVFNYGTYALRLNFDQVNGPFVLTITNAVTSQADLVADGRLNNFPGWTCVPIDGANCVDFEVSAPAAGPTTWTGFFDLGVLWAADTDPTFPNGPTNRIRLLHNRGDVAGNGFDTDVTVIGSYFAGGIDPGIGGRDDNFQSFLVVQAPAAVPEPGTLALVGTAFALAWRARRRP